MELLYFGVVAGRGGRDVARSAGAGSWEGIILDGGFIRCLREWLDRYEGWCCLVVGRHPLRLQDTVVGMGDGEEVSARQEKVREGNK